MLLLLLLLLRLLHLLLAQQLLHNIMLLLPLPLAIQHEVPYLDSLLKKTPRAPEVCPAHEKFNGYMMPVGTRGNYIWALGAHR